jgi:hypothetical protein
VREAPIAERDREVVHERTRAGVLESEHAREPSLAEARTVNEEIGVNGSYGQILGKVPLHEILPNRGEHRPRCRIRLPALTPVQEDTKSVGREAIAAPSPHGPSREMHPAEEFSDLGSVRRAKLEHCSLPSRDVREDTDMVASPEGQDGTESTRRHHHGHRQTALHETLEDGLLEARVPRGTVLVDAHEKVPEGCLHIVNSVDGVRDQTPGSNETSKTEQPQVASKHRVRQVRINRHMIMVTQIRAARINAFRGGDQPV